MLTVSRFWLSKNFRLLRKTYTFSLRCPKKTVNVFFEERKFYLRFVLLISHSNPYSLVIKNSLNVRYTLKNNLLALVGDLEVL